MSTWAYSETKGSNLVRVKECAKAFACCGKRRVGSTQLQNDLGNGRTETRGVCSFVVRCKDRLIIYKRLTPLGMGVFTFLNPWAT